MYDEPDEPRAEAAADPAARAAEQADNLRMHAELAATFEGPRKFEASVVPGLDADVARSVQQAMGKLGQVAATKGSILTNVDDSAMADEVLRQPLAREQLTTNDYHVLRRPGEAILIRWLAGDEVDAFYGRLQAHFDAGLEGLIEDERQALEWKREPGVQAYLSALDELKVDMAERFKRDVVRQARLSVMSTTAADEMNIAFLCDHLMGVPPADVVGAASAPDPDAGDAGLAWFFKLFSLRGWIDGEERMCFFTFLQRAGDDEW